MFSHAIVNAFPSIRSFALALGNCLTLICQPQISSCVLMSFPTLPMTTPLMTCSSIYVTQALKLWCLPQWLPMNSRDLPMCSIGISGKHLSGLV